MSVAPQTLKHNFLGRSGLKVSELCLGAMTFAHKEGVLPGWAMPCIGEEAAHAMLDRFAEVGVPTSMDLVRVRRWVRHLNLSFAPRSEPPFYIIAAVGSWLSKVQRDDFVIATKFGLPAGPGSNDVGGSRKHIIRAVEQSLERLGTHYIDLYQIHSWDSGALLKETLLTLHDLVRIGKVRYTGCSNYKGFQIQKSVDLSQQLNIEAYSSFQGQYSLLARAPEFEILPVCQNEGLGYLPWSPLKGGWLSGRYKRSQQGPEAGSRVEWASQVGWTQTSYNEYANERTWRILDTVERIAKQKQTSMATVALRWVVQRPGVTSTIIGARTMTQLEENLEAGFITLAKDEMEVLTHVSEPFAEYPYDIVGKTRGVEDRVRPDVYV